MTDAPYEVRAAAAGALLARHLYRCVRCDAAGEPMPELDLDAFGSPDAIDYHFAVVAALLGIDPSDDRKRHRVMIVMQALAEMIVEQGAQLECEFAGIIHDEERHIIVARVVPA